MFFFACLQSKLFWVSHDLRINTHERQVLVHWYFRDFRDLSRAYKQIIPIDLRDIAFVGYVWTGNIYFDLMLSMGLRSSAHICQRLTNSLAYMHRNLGFETVLTILPELKINKT